MKYLGGKHGIGKRIAEFITKACVQHPIDGYLEPFCGSLGVFKFISMQNKYKKYIASDIQPDLIAMWKQIQENKLNIPNSMSESEYNRLKEAPSPNAMKAVAGFGLSFGGKYFAGYAQKWAGNSGRNFLNEFKSSIEKIKPAIQKKSVHFYNKSYTTFNPHNMLIYCDPPYQNTEEYSTGKFDSKLFWEIMRKWSKDNCVFISEESAPSDFKVVWKLKKRRTLDKKSRFYKYEKIYMYDGSKIKLNKSFSKNKATTKSKTRKILFNKLNSS
jgi:DNA adenine methylase